jgi:MoaA/NifB/PqqE/SkfB family radical SAM enzyme
MGTEEMKDALRQSWDLGARCVVLTGGEPLVRADLFDLCAFASRMGFFLKLFTNGTLLDRHWSMVREFFPAISVSYDGPDAARFDALRGKGSFDMLVRSISTMKANAPEVSIVGRCTFTKHNYADMVEIVESARSLGLTQLGFQPVTGSSAAFGGNRIAAVDARLSETQIAELRGIIRSLAVRKRDLFLNHFLLQSPRQLMRICDYMLAQRGLWEFGKEPCHEPEEALVIGANGNVKPCMFLPPIGNLRDAPLSHILHTLASSLRERSFEPGMAAGCLECCCRLENS